MPICLTAIFPQVKAWLLAMALLPVVLALVTGGDMLMDFVDVATGQSTTQYVHGSFPCLTCLHKEDGRVKGQLFNLGQHLLLGSLSLSPPIRDILIHLLTSDTSR